MSLFDLFRGFFGFPRGSYPGDRRRDPFFEGMTRDDDDDDDDEGEDEEALRFGFSFGPGGMHFEEPAAFRELFREVEELLAGVGRWDGLPSSTPFAIPSIEAPGRQERGRSPRDFMLRHPDSTPSSDQGDREPPSGPFSKFDDVWRGGLWRAEEGEPLKQDGDLDSQVSSEGLEKILTPAQPRAKSKSFFKSVTVTKVVSPDGTVEERRTVRDSQGNEETTVTRSGPADRSPQIQQGPPEPGVSPGSSGMQDDASIFSRFFGGFRDR
ncbi:HCLS1-associated protein X-1 isoform X1 [Lepisosteus oculatus]|uniref:HCLS1-associated protein X-1 isoform X1 n=2 Tax=Lepisosteus oculatus TaxID=7918 RepID=UPI0037212AD9